MEKSNKRQIKLLTAIAVAALIVSVGGTTYAYFSTAGSNTSTSTTATVRTEIASANSFSIDNNGVLQLTVNSNNLANNDNSVAASGKNVKSNIVTAHVYYSRGNDTNSTNFCYDIYVNPSLNTLVYTSPTIPADEATALGLSLDANYRAPELLLLIKRKNIAPFTSTTSTTTYDFTAATTVAVPTSDTAKFKKIDNNSNSTYKNTYLNGDLVNSTKITTDELTEYRSYGSDVTVLPTGSNNYGRITIPGLTSAGYATADELTFQLVYINYKWNQSNTKNSNNNANKQFNATIRLEKVSC